MAKMRAAIEKNPVLITKTLEEAFEYVDRGEQTTKMLADCQFLLFKAATSSARQKTAMRCL